MTRARRILRRASGIAGGLVLASLAACSSGTDQGSAAPVTSANPSASASATGTSASGSAGATATTDGGSDNAGVKCSGNSCSLTLSGEHQAHVLGTTIKLADVQNGRATLAVGTTEVSCGQGQTISAGPLKLECSTITADSVSLTASLG
jgi:hypothetical protein